MRTFHYIIAAISAALIMGCGSGQKGLKTPEAQSDYDWGDYKGTYAPGAPATKGQADAPPPAEKKPASDSKASDAKPETKEAKTEGSDAKSMYAEGDDAKPAEDDAAPPKKKKKKKKGGNASGSKGTSSPSAATPKKAPRKRAKR